MNTVGFIGCGNMGGAIARAVAKSHTECSILLSDWSSDKARELAEQIGAKVSDNAEIAKNADIIFLGVKPQILESVIKEINSITKNKDGVLVVSMAAGVEIKKIENMFGHQLSLIRIMPNTPVAVGEGMVLYVTNENVTAEQLDVFLTVMAKAGKLDAINEKLIDAASALSGCGPAFVFMFLEAMADGAVACGLPRDKALTYASQTLLGSAVLQANSGAHPEALKDAVCSPGGSTIIGVKALEDGGMRGTVINAVCEAFKKTKELGK